MITKIILIVCWIVSCLAEGKRDAFFYHNRNSSTNPDHHNIHWIFSVERFIIWALITALYSHHNFYFSTGVFSLGIILVFSFLHNGMYYATRNNLDKNVYPKRWWDTSTTSESLMEFNVVQRVFMAVTGTLGIITSILISLP